MTTYVWAPHEVNAWEVAQVTAQTDRSTTVKYPDNSSKVLPVGISGLDLAQPDALRLEYDNLVDLDVFNEGVILHHVKKRFLRNTIYTFVGNILIAVNPYKKVDIYKEDAMESCLKAVKQSGGGNLQPHVFSIAALALHGLRTDSTDHSVLISGESGAGKTEATKKILQFISSVSTSTSSRAGINVESQILDSNPLLESFGNAKTLRNNNSSRFGKYMQINFNKRHAIKGCNVTCYLLEKSRVVRQNLGERNYHIFYMLIAGASVEMRKDLFLKSADSCYYLAQSKCVDIPKRDEVREYADLVASMANLNFDKEHQKHIFQCLAGILHLGNIVFSPFHGEGSGAVEGSHIKAKADLKNAAQLLGFSSPENLERSLCFRELIIGSDTTYSPIDVVKACDQRDALAKYIYGKLFDWIVYGVNNVLYRGKPGNNIGILDIFGFEVFQVNSFEQLCINYCNERLQTFFNEVIFEGEMKVYEAEGIACDGIAFKDNKGCVRLIDLKGAGIFSFLDEEINLPKGSEEKLAKKLHHVFDETAGTKSPYYGRIMKAPNSFIVKHFAGEVTYVIDNFLEKNKDTLAQSLLNHCNASSVALVRDPVPIIDMSSGSGGDAKPSQPVVASPTPDKGGKPAGKPNNKLTLCAKFKLDLDDLVTTLRNTTPHFIRCVKPNDVQTADKFDSVLALNQLKYSGLFEAINIRKAGYACRIPHDKFIELYSPCVPVANGGNKRNWGKKAPNVKSSGSVNSASKTKKPPAICFGLLEFLAREIKNMNVDGQPAHWAVGKQRVFIRNQAFRAKLDAYRTNTVLNEVVVQIQRIGRGFCTRKRVAHMFKKGSSKEQLKKQEATERVLMAKEEEISILHEKEFSADKVLQASIRAAREANRLAKLEKENIAKMKAAVLIQSRFRGTRNRMYGRIFMLESMLEKAIRFRSESHLENGIRFTTGFFYALQHQHRPKRKAVPKNHMAFSLSSSLNSANARSGPCTWGYSVRLLHAYHVNAKEILLQVQGESYMCSQLQTAINTQSVDILQDAIRTAEELKMDYLPILHEAKAMLSERLHERTVLATITDELSKCVTIPKLLSRVDKINEMLQQAAKLGLEGDYVVHNAAVRINKLSNLISVRNRLRYSVEIASLSKMDAAMEERQKHVKLFGEELFEEEVIAVNGIRKMIQYEEQIKHISAFNPDSHDVFEQLEGNSENDVENTADADKKGILTNTTNKKVKFTVMFNESSKRDNDSENGDIFHDDIEISAPDARLPPTLRHMLDEMRYARTPEELQIAVDRFSVLVPNANQRKAFLTAFKWVVAFATWKYSFKSSAELQTYEQQKRIISETINSPVKKQINTDFGGTVKVSPHQEQYRRPTTLLERLSSPGFSFGSPVSAVKREQANASNRKESLKQLQQQSMRTMPSQYDDDFDRMSPTDMMSSPPAAARRRFSTASTLSKMSSRSSNYGSVMSTTSNGSNSNIPFSQRRSKSEVAAMDALKKAKAIGGVEQHKGEFGRAEALIQSSIESGEREFKKFGKQKSWA